MLSKGYLLENNENEFNKEAVDALKSEINVFK